MCLLIESHLEHGSVSPTMTHNVYSSPLRLPRNKNQICIFANFHMIINYHLFEFVSESSSQYKSPMTSTGRQHWKSHLQGPKETEESMEAGKVIELIFLRNY